MICSPCQYGIWPLKTESINPWLFYGHSKNKHLSGPCPGKPRQQANPVNRHRLGLADVHQFRLDLAAALWLWCRLGVGGAAAHDFNRCPLVRILIRPPQKGQKLKPFAAIPSFMN